MALKPVLIFRCARTEGPGHFATFLDANRVPWRLVKLDEGEAVPEAASGASGLGFMGGPMSANDELAWTRPVLDLMRDAVARRIPVIGHCLGGQLLARALGATVAASPVTEIGWNPVEVEGTSLARNWFGPDLHEFETFQWHAESFAIPDSGERILRGKHCRNQAYVVGDRHLGLQCHVEMTPELIRSWCEIGADEVRDALGSPAVQDVATIQAQMAERLPVLRDVAERLYRRWAAKLAA
jgi:GMP synthase-like glutamine amidotransferase